MGSQCAGHECLFKMNFWFFYKPVSRFGQQRTKGYPDEMGVQANKGFDVKALVRFSPGLTDAVGIVADQIILALLFVLS